MANRHVVASVVAVSIAGRPPIPAALRSPLLRFHALPAGAAGGLRFRSDDQKTMGPGRGVMGEESWQLQGIPPATQEPASAQPRPTGCQAL